MDAETQDRMNAEIAEALRALGLDEALAGRRRYECEDGHTLSYRLASNECAFYPGPSAQQWCHKPVHPVLTAHDFTNPVYLLPALEAWHQADPSERTWSLSSGWWDHTWHRMTEPWALVRGYGAHGTTPIEALHAAFHRALTEEASE